VRAEPDGILRFVETGISAGLQRGIGDMSGHSKWSQIKRQKGVTDAKRGQVFTRLGREIAVAARDGADPTANSRLRLAIQRARDANMPMDTVERAVKRGSGHGEGAEYHEMSYEGYGPGGVAVLVEVLTDNRNRTAAEVRSAFSKSGGNLGESGSVRWLFDPKGILTLDLDSRNPDEVAMQAIDAGADDFEFSDDAIEVYTEPGKVEEVRSALEAKGVPVVSSETSMVPKTAVELDEKTAEQAMRLIDRLEELDDVQQVHSNFDVSDEVAASLSA
jgi:YebC/PmpR family DNA-binding regulatory protein